VLRGRRHVVQHGVVVGFGFGRRNVADEFEHPPVVEPVDPFQCGDLYPALNPNHPNQVQPHHAQRQTLQVIGGRRAATLTLLPEYIQLNQFVETCDIEVYRKLTAGKGTGYRFTMRYKLSLTDNVSATRTVLAGSGQPAREVPLFSQARSRLGT